MVPNKVNWRQVDGTNSPIMLQIAIEPLREAPPAEAAQDSYSEKVLQNII